LGFVGKNMKITIGKLWWKKDWYSICSMHRKYREDCLRCNTGEYINRWKHNISSFIFDNFPAFWRKAKIYKYL
jgi:hypothetical protein